MMPILWVCSAVQSEHFQLFTLSKTLAWLDKAFTRTKRSEISRSTGSWDVFLLLQPMLTGTELEESITNPDKTSDMLRISSTCWTDLIRPTTGLILSLSRLLKYYLFFMPSTSSTAQLQLSGILPHQELTSTLLLLEQLEPFMVLSMEEPTKQF